MNITTTTTKPVLTTHCNYCGGFKSFKLVSSDRTGYTIKCETCGRSKYVKNH